MQWFLSILGLIGLAGAALGVTILSDSKFLPQQIAGILGLGFGLVLAALGFGLRGVIEQLRRGRQEQRESKGPQT